MTSFDEQGRPRPPSAGSEVETLLGFLDYQRATIEWKCRGLNAEGLNARLGASSMSLGGLLQHLAYVEEYWFHFWWRGEDLSQPWGDVDWVATPNGEWDLASNHSPEELFTKWRQAVERARDVVNTDLASGTLDELAPREEDGQSPSRRWILCHLIEEYARHCGHADLLREAIDGETGE